MSLFFTILLQTEKKYNIKRSHPKNYVVPTLMRVLEPLVD